MTILVISLLSLFFPWKFRRLILIYFLGYEIDKSAVIGFSLICVDKLVMKEGSKIGSLTFVKKLIFLQMDTHSSIGNLNWISGFRSLKDTLHFYDQPSRLPQLILGEHSHLTNRHYIDCTDSIFVGKFSTIAGCRSQFITHSINIESSRQCSGPIIIGDYVFIGSGCILLPNTSLPSFSVLGAGAVLNKKFLNENTLYAGVPAKAIKIMSKKSSYFHRKIGYVY